MKKSAKILMMTLAVCVILGIGAVSFAAWKGGSSSVVTASGSTGQVRLVGGITAETDDGAYNAQNPNVIDMQTLYPVDYTGDGLKRWKFTLNAEVMDNSDMMYTIRGGLTKGGAALSPSVAELYWSSEPVTNANPENGVPIDSVGSNICVASDSPQATVYVYMTAGSVAAMDADISLTFEVAPLAAENMAWKAADGLICTGDDAQTYKLGVAENWIISYDFYLPKNADGAFTDWYFAAYIGGENKLVGIEYAWNAWGHRKFASYGSPWGLSCPDQPLSDGVLNLLHASTDENPANVIIMRDGNKVKAFIATVDGYELIGLTDIDIFKLKNNNFGLGARNNLPRPNLKSIKYMVGSNQIAIFNKTLDSVVPTTDDNVTLDKQSYVIGDKATLTVKNDGQSGKTFAHFTANGIRFDGNTYDIKGAVHFAAVYKDVSTITLGDGVKLRDGSTGSVKAAEGETVTLAYIMGSAESGKRFGSFVVDGNPIDGNTFTVTGATHNVTVAYVDKVASNGVALNDISKASDANNFVYDPSHPEWSRYDATFDTSVKYDGSDAAVSEAGLLKVTVTGDECSIAIKDDSLTEINLDETYDSLYFYVYTEVEGCTAGGRWCGDVLLTPYAWTKVTFTKDMFPIKITDNVPEDISGSVWRKGMSAFAYRLHDQYGVGSIDQCVFYLTGVYGTPSGG